MTNYISDIKLDHVVDKDHIKQLTLSITQKNQQLESYLPIIATLDQKTEELSSLQQHYKALDTLMQQTTAKHSSYAQEASNRINELVQKQQIVTEESNANQEVLEHRLDDRVMLCKKLESDNMKLKSEIDDARQDIGSEKEAFKNEILGLKEQLDMRMFDFDRLILKNTELIELAVKVKQGNDEDLVRGDREVLMLMKQKEKFEGLAGKMEERYRDSEMLIEKLVCFFV